MRKFPFSDDEDEDEDEDMIGIPIMGDELDATLLELSHSRAVEILRLATAFVDSSAYARFLPFRVRLRMLSEAYSLMSRLAED